MPAAPLGSPWEGLQKWSLRGSVILVIVAMGSAVYWTGSRDTGAQESAATRSRWQLSEIPFDGSAAMQWVQRLCELGSRPSGSDAMRQQQELLAGHFRQLGGKVTLQPFAVRHPETGRPVTMNNLWVQWHPERAERILLCAHYDTRPFPDRDPLPENRRRGVFLGANDGASGVAVLCVLGRDMPQLEAPWGVDFVLFDGEELVYNERRDQYFLGSTYFAQQLVHQEHPFRYRAAILLDMVGDASLEVYQEVNSVRWTDSRPLVDSIWATAERLQVGEFVGRRRHEVRDDHVPLHEIAGIPAIDIIDFDYPYPGSRTSFWHTTADVPANCSALSLAKVGWVLQQWLQSITPPGSLERLLGAESTSE